MFHCLDAKVDSGRARSCGWAWGSRRGRRMLAHHQPPGHGESQSLHRGFSAAQRARGMLLHCIKQRSYVAPAVRGGTPCAGWRQSGRNHLWGAQPPRARGPQVFAHAPRPPRARPRAQPQPCALASHVHPPRRLGARVTPPTCLPPQARLSSPGLAQAMPQPARCRPRAGQRPNPGRPPYRFAPVRQPPSSWRGARLVGPPGAGQCCRAGALAGSARKPAARPCPIPLGVRSLPPPLTVARQGS